MRTASKWDSDHEIYAGAQLLDWPHLPHPGLTEVTINRGSNLEPVKDMQECYDWKRTALLKEGKTVLNWERPPQKWPEKTDGIKGTSTLVNGHH